MTIAPVLVVIELNEGVPSGNSLELLAVADRISDGGEDIVAACLGAGMNDEIVSELAARGASRVILVDDPVFEPFQADAWVKELAVLARELKPTTLLLPHSLPGTDVAARLAFRLETAVVMGCIGVDTFDGKTHWTRSCYGGNAREVVSITSQPAVATISAKSFEPLPLDSDASTVVEKRATLVTPSDVRTRVTAKSVGPDSGAKLETADTIVSGGRGLGGAQQFEKLSELAELLGGAVGASRVACDLGWCPASWQIGLSGKTVAPDLYFAVGISGAVHHLAGCSNAGVIVAVNTDADAEIFKSAHFGVEADCNEFLPALIREVRKIRSQ